MKKLLTVVFTMLVAGSLAFAQTNTGDKGATSGSGGTIPPIRTTGKKATKTTTKAHKGGKKGKKSTTPTSTTPTPK
jgi:hypothetical protein